MICFARFGCDEQAPQPSAGKLAKETCLITMQFQSAYQRFFVLLLIMSILFIYVPLFWNLGKTVKSGSGIIRLVMPYILYNIAVFLLEIIWPTLLNNKLSVDINETILNFDPVDFCPSSGTVGTANGEVGCKRNFFFSLTDSLVQSIRTFLFSTTLSAGINGTAYAGSPIGETASSLLFLTTAVSAYLHK